MKIDPTKNTLICGDNVKWLNWTPNNSIDLCYIDPPFFTNKDYGEFKDKFKDIKEYIEWMRPRIELIHKKLKDTGSIFLHCDWHASHRLRVLLDDIFGEKNFINEIIWYYGQRNLKHIKHINRKHDSIFWYYRTDKYVYNELRTKYTIEEIRSWRGTKTDLKGEYYLENAGKNKPRYKRYVTDILKDGKLLDDVWKIRILGSNSSERIGYPTQKPESLIKRIVECASNPGDMVLDCFSGGGTTAKVCADLNRKFIVGDVSSKAIEITNKRLDEKCSNVTYETKIIK